MSYNKTKSKNQNSIKTLNDYIKEIYLPLDVDNGEHKKTSISFDKSMSGYIMEYFNDYNLKDIRSLDIDLFLKYLRTERKQKNGIGMAPKTVKHVYSELDRIFKSAKKRRLIDENPMDFVSQPKTPKKEVKALSEEEMNIFVRELKKAPPRLGLVWKTEQIVLNQQNRDRSQINKGKKRSIQFVISGGNPAKPFDFLKETLNQMAFFV